MTDSSQYDADDIFTLIASCLDSAYQWGKWGRTTESFDGIREMAVATIRALIEARDEAIAEDTWDRTGC